MQGWGGLLASSVDLQEEPVRVLAPVAFLSQIHEVQGWQRRALGPLQRGLCLPEWTLDQRPVAVVGGTKLTLQHGTHGTIKVRGGHKCDVLANLVGLGSPVDMMRVSFSSQMGLIGGFTFGFFDLELGCAPFWACKVEKVLKPGTNPDVLSSVRHNSRLGVEIPLTVSFLNPRFGARNGLLAWQRVYCRALLLLGPDSCQPTLLPKCGVTVVPNQWVLNAMPECTRDMLKQTFSKAGLNLELTHDGQRASARVSLVSNFDWSPQGVGSLVPLWW